MSVILKSYNLEERNVVVNIDSNASDSTITIPHQIKTLLGAKNYVIEEAQKIRNKRTLDLSSYVGQDLELL